MGATAAPERDMDAGPADKAAAERTCALTRESLTPETVCASSPDPTARSFPMSDAASPAGASGFPAAAAW